MNISKAAQASGISTKMIRYYEEIGLISAPQRTNAGYRIYSEKDVEHLQFIFHSRQLGFSLEHIKTLLALWHNQNRQSSHVKQLAQQHVDELNIKIQQLNDIKQQLENLIQHCAGNHSPECSILNNIATQNK